MKRRNFISMFAGLAAAIPFLGLVTNKSSYIYIYRLIPSNPYATFAVMWKGYLPNKTVEKFCSLKDVHTTRGRFTSHCFFTNKLSEKKFEIGGIGAIVK